MIVKAYQEYSLLKLSVFLLSKSVQKCESKCYASVNIMIRLIQ